MEWSRTITLIASAAILTSTAFGVGRCSCAHAQSPSVGSAQAPAGIVASNSVASPIRKTTTGDTRSEYLAGADRTIPAAGAANPDNAASDYAAIQVLALAPALTMEQLRLPTVPAGWPSHSSNVLTESGPMSFSHYHEGTADDSHQGVGPLYALPAFPELKRPATGFEVPKVSGLNDSPSQREPLGPVASVRPVVVSESPTSMLTQPWWTGESTEPLTVSSRSQAWELDQLIWLAVENSPFVRAVLIEPQILDARAAATNGQFDPAAFVESIFRDTSDPVGNTLITGSASRLNEHIWNNTSGVRAKNARGGVAELSQDFNFHDSNSDFFIPSNQADTRMFLRYTQPLARGGGIAYNRATFAIAALAADQSLQSAVSQIQDHTFAITSSYWQLVAARAINRQITRSLERMATLRDQLAGRADLDSLKSQLWRADAAISRQQASQARARAQIRASEANLKAAVAAPELRTDFAELIPATLPSDWAANISRTDELTTALNFHPNIQALRVEIKSSRVKLQVAENELRPTLNLVLESYLRGLNGDFDATRSFGDQFSTGAPSYSAGLSYLRPVRNVAATAILRERRLELRRTLLQLDNALLNISADVESAIGQVGAAFQELESSVRSTLATHYELDYLNARWTDAFLDNTQRNLLLDQLLNAELQLLQAENAWAQAQSDHMISIAKLRLATGSLLPMVHVDE